MAKPLALRHGRRIASARFSARLISYMLESKQRYYSLPVMKLNVEIAVVLTEDMHCNNKGCPNGQPLKAESFTFCCR